MEQAKKQVIDAAKAYYRKMKQDTLPSAEVQVSGKVLDEADLINMIEASLDMWLTAGRFNDTFEKSFAKYLGVKHVLTVNSGSSANLLALAALTSYKLGDKALKKGDEVITVAAAFPTTVSPIVQYGLVPVFIDCDKNGNIDADKIATAITPRTKAVLLAHTLGIPFNLDKVQALCKKHNLYLIEDTCDALGAEWNGKKVGTFGDIGTFSFYPAHHITMGEGGALATNNSELYRILISFRDWGRDCWCPSGKNDSCSHRFSLQLGHLPFGYDHKYTYSHLGYNLKITDWQAAIGCSQLEKLPSFIETRRKNAAYLLAKLQDLTDFFYLPAPDKASEPSWFGILLSVKETAPFTKRDAVLYLEKHNIATRQLFAGNILRQPALVEQNIALRIGNGVITDSADLGEQDYVLLPETEFMMNNAFWVGCFPALDKEKLDRISDTLHDFVTKERSK